MTTILFISSQADQCPLYHQIEAMPSLPVNVLADLRSLYKHLRASPPSLILLHLQGIDGAIRSVVSRLRAMLIGTNIPFVLVQNDMGEPSQIDGLSWGAEEVISARRQDEMILSRLQNLAGMNEVARKLSRIWKVPPHHVMGLCETHKAFTQSRHIALIGPLPAPEQCWKDKMAQMRDVKLDYLSYNDCFFLSPSSRAFDLCIVFCPSADYIYKSLTFLVQLSKLEPAKYANFCFVAPTDCPEASIAFQMGANEVVDHDISSDELLLRLEQLLRRRAYETSMREVLEKALTDSVLDPLTGAFNRRHAMLKTADLIEDANQAKTELAIMAIDIDHFKKVNELYGHSAGDLTLIEITKRVSKLLRADDFLARVGGDEFLCVMPNISHEAVTFIAQACCSALRSRPIALHNGKKIDITISIGIDSRRYGYNQNPPIQEALELADRALLEAKRNGRDQFHYGLTEA